MRKSFTLHQLFFIAFFTVALSAAATAQTTTAKPTAAPKPVVCKITEANTSLSGVDAKGSPFGTASAKEMQAATPVWNNYNGIADAEKAKQAWIQDNPDAWKAMQQQNSTPNQK